MRLLLSVLGLIKTKKEQIYENKFLFTSDLAKDLKRSCYYNFSRSHCLCGGKIKFKKTKLVIRRTCTKCYFIYESRWTYDVLVGKIIRDKR